MVILYKCFHIFPTHFVNFFSQFVSGSIFYQVFLHWSQGVRKIFHLLLRFKLMAPQLEKDKHLNLERKTLIYKY